VRVCGRQARPLGVWLVSPVSVWSGASSIITGSASGRVGAVYSENIRLVTAFFARRCRDLQQVADLTSQTFVEAIKSARTVHGRGTPAAWLIAIARRVYANHLADTASGADLIDQLGGQLVLVHEEVEDLAARIDAQRDGKELLEGAARLSGLERDAIELVDGRRLVVGGRARATGCVDVWAGDRPSSPDPGREIRRGCPHQAYRAVDVLVRSDRRARRRRIRLRLVSRGGAGHACCACSFASSLAS
jgi:DNA-directed RNA polymerase specialized sigma24 family protein